MLIQGEDVAYLDSFRGQVRAWLETNCPDSMTDMPQDEIVWGGRKQNWFGLKLSNGWAYGSTRLDSPALAQEVRRRRT